MKDVAMRSSAKAATPAQQVEHYPISATRIVKASQPSKYRRTDWLKEDFHKISKHWDIHLEQAKLMFGDGLSSRSVTLATKCASHGPITLVLPLLWRAQHERRFRLPSKNGNPNLKNTNRKTPWIPSDFENVINLFDKDALSQAAYRDMAIPYQGRPLQRAASGLTGTTVSDNDAINNGGMRLRTRQVGGNAAVSNPSNPLLLGIHQDAPAIEQPGLAASGRPFSRHLPLPSESTSPEALSPNSGITYPEEMDLQQPTSPGAAFASPNTENGNGQVNPDSLPTMPHTPDDDIDLDDLVRFNNSCNLLPSNTSVTNNGASFESSMGVSLAQIEGRGSVEPGPWLQDAAQQPDADMKNFAIFDENEQPEAAEPHEQPTPSGVLRTLNSDACLGGDDVFRVLSVLAGASPTVFAVIDPSLSAPGSNHPIQVEPDMTVFAPINLRNRHWILAIFDGQNKNGELYVSNAQESDSTNMDIMRGLFSRLYPTTQIMTWDMSEIHTPLHSDSHDCGIAALVIAFYYIGLRLLPPTPIAGNVWRHLFSPLLSKRGDSIAWVREEVGFRSLLYSISGATEERTSFIPKILDNCRLHFQTILQRFGRRPNLGQQSIHLNALRQTVEVACSMANTIREIAVNDAETLQGQAERLDETISSYKVDPCYLPALLGLHRTPIPLISELVLQATQEHSIRCHGYHRMCVESADSTCRFLNYASLVLKEIDRLQGELNAMTGLGGELNTNKVLLGFPPGLPCPF